MIYSNDNVYIGITNDNLDLNSAFNFINLSDCGGNSFFVGTTRDYEEDEHKQRIQIKGLYYESYEAMAFKKMIQIVEDIMRMNNEIRKCYVLHRIGFVNSGQASILIATNSKGRDDCSNATMNILCKIKQEVPIWKKVIYLNDELNDKNDDNKLNNKNQETSNNQLKTDWIMKSEAFWLNK